MNRFDTCTFLVHRYTYFAVAEVSMSSKVSKETLFEGVNTVLQVIS